MVSAYIKGTYRIYIESPSGTRKLVMSAPAYWYCLTGSSDGVIAQTSEKWNYLPVNKEVGVAGYKIVVTIQGVAATMDASDGVWIIPVIVNGILQIIGNPANVSGLGNDNFTTDLTPADITLVAANETPVAVIRAKEGIRFQVGGGKVFLSIEDNA